MKKYDEIKKVIISDCCGNNQFRLKGNLKPGQYQRTIDAKNEPTNFCVLRTFEDYYLLADRKKDMPDFQCMIQVNKSTFFAKKMVRHL